MVLKENKAFAFFCIFALAALALAVPAAASFFWHSAQDSQKNPESWLESYPSIVSGKKACIGLGYGNLEEGFAEGFSLRANSRPIEYSIESAGSESAEVCFDAGALSDGNNFIDLNIGSRRLFFHAEKTAGSAEDAKPELEVLKFEKKNDSKGLLSFRIKNIQGENERARIAVNGIEARSAFFKDGVHEEAVPLVAGKNTAIIEFQGISKSAGLENSVSWKSSIALGLLACALLLAALFAIVFGRIEGLAERLSLSMISLVSLIALLSYALALLGILSGIALLACVIVLSLALAFAFRKRFSIPRIRLEFGLFEAFLAILFAMALLINLLTPASYSYWTAFYEHQSQAIFDSGGIPFLDEHLNFGEKPYGYVSGYFFANAGISSLTGSFGEHSFAILLALACIGLALSAFVFFKKTGFGKRKALLCVMLMLLGSFLFSDFFFTPRHIIALSLGFAALSLLYDRRLAWAAVALGLAMFFQAPAVIIIAAIGLALYRGRLSSLAKLVAAGFAVGVFLFLPSLLAHGIPWQADSGTWGYLFGMPYYGVLTDLLAQIVFFFAIMLPAAKFRPKLDNFSKRIAAVLLALIAIQLLMSYRVNVATIAVFSFLGVYLFPEKLLEKKNIERILFAIFAIGTVFMCFLLLGFFAPSNALQAEAFLAGNTPDSERLLAEPALGHLTAFLTEKKIMSDLAVEYENQKYLDDSFSFLETGNRGILDKYKISFVFNRANFIETQPVGSEVLQKPLEFEGIDKIYDNGEFFIHRNG